MASRKTRSAELERDVVSVFSDRHRARSSRSGQPRRETAEEISAQMKRAEEAWRSWESSPRFIPPIRPAPSSRRFFLVNAQTGERMRRAHDFEVEQIAKSRHGTVLMDLGAVGAKQGTYEVKLLDADERFAVSKGGKPIPSTESASMQGAMSKAPPSGDVSVKGEYTSDGTYWGLGLGRVMARRENGRWLVG